MTTRQVHLVTTRYNVGLYRAEGGDPRLQVDADGWMQDRYRLFTTFTLPSLRSQTCQDFAWFVFLDPRTPARFVDELVAVADSYPGLRIEPATRPIVSFLKERIADSGADIAMTSRIDNDDAWHSDYVRSLQRGGYQPGTVVDYPDSYWLDVASRALYYCRARWWTGGGWWRRWRTLLTPRISNSPTVVESAAAARTVLGLHHRQLHRLYGRRHVVLIPDRPYRLVTCHRHNLVNRIGSGEGSFTRVSLEVLRDFGIDTDFEVGPPP